MKFCENKAPLKHFSALKHSSLIVIQGIISSSNISGYSQKPHDILPLIVCEWCCAVMSYIALINKFLM